MKTLNRVILCIWNHVIGLLEKSWLMHWMCVNMQIQVFCDGELCCLWLSCAFTCSIYLPHSKEQCSEK